MNLLFRKVEKGHGNDEKHEAHDDESEGEWKAGDLLSLDVALSHEDEEVEPPYPGLLGPVLQPNLQQDAQDSKRDCGNPHSLHYEPIRDS